MATKPESEYHQPIAEMMAREGVTLREAATRLRVPIGSEEAANLFRTKAFQRLLRGERNRYYLEVGQDAEWRRKTAIGMLLHCVNQLIQNAEFDKAAEVILKASRVEGWLGAETQVSVFNSLSQKDLDLLRTKVKDKIASADAN
jgi:hypothetical protein